jgi:uncharacterized protein (DUF58 family)
VNVGEVSNKTKTKAMKGDGRYKWRSWRKWQLPIQLRFTREGKYFFWISLGMGLAAINTGNNLLYLLLGMMLGLIVISGILCNIVLKKLVVKRLLPAEIFADTPCLISLSVTNQKRFFSSFSIEIEDRLVDQNKGKKCYFLKISPGATQKTAYRLIFARRGRYILEQFRISSQFPFGLFVKTWIVHSEEEIIVYPKISSVPILTGHTPQRAGWTPSLRRGQGMEFCNLREMQVGDELRWIHWPSTARTGKLQVREFADEQKPQIDILLWQIIKSGVAHPDIHLDSAVNLVASLLVAYLRMGQVVRFASATDRFAPIDHPSLLPDILQYLSLIEPLNGSSRLSWIDEFSLIIASPLAHIPDWLDSTRLIIASERNVETPK